MTARTMTLKGHDKVQAQLSIDTDLPEAMQIRGAVITLEVSGDRVVELGNALQKALNTTMDAPAWLLDLCDMCDAARGQFVPRPMVRPDVPSTPQAV
jgi:hypothetical protein